MLMSLQQVMVRGGLDLESEMLEFKLSSMWSEHGRGSVLEADMVQYISFGVGGETDVWTEAKTVKTRCGVLG